MLEQLVKSYTFDLLNFMVGVAALLVPALGLLWRMWRKQFHADELVVQQGRRIDEMAARHTAESKKQRDAIALLKGRLAEIDPERFIDALDALEAKHDLSGAEALSEAFTERQTEAFGRAAALLAERELYAADTEEAASQALRFATIGLAADPENAALVEIRSTATARQEAARNGEPMESIAMEGLSDVELNRLAIHLNFQRKYHHALAAARRSVPLALARTGERSANYAGALGAYAKCRDDVGDHSEAEALLREALEISRVVFGKAHPVYAVTLGNLAESVKRRGRLPEAETLYREALEIDRATDGEGHPGHAIRLNNLANLLLKQNRPDEARPLFQQALSILESTLPADHPDIASTRQSLANLP